MDDIPYVLLLNVDAQWPLCCYVRSAHGHACKSCFLLLKKELLALACIGLKAFFYSFFTRQEGGWPPLRWGWADGGYAGSHFLYSKMAFNQA